MQHTQRRLPALRRCWEAHAAHAHARRRRRTVLSNSLLRRLAKAARARTPRARQTQRSMAALAAHSCSSVAGGAGAVRQLRRRGLGDADGARRAALPARAVVSTSCDEPRLTQSRVHVLQATAQRGWVGGGRAVWSSPVVGSLAALAVLLVGTRATAGDRTAHSLARTHSPRPRPRPLARGEGALGLLTNCFRRRCHRRR